MVKKCTCWLNNLAVLKKNHSYLFGSGYHIIVLFSIHFPLYLVYDNLKRTEVFKQTGLGGRMRELVKAEGSSSAAPLGGSPKSCRSKKSYKSFDF